MKKSKLNNLGLEQMKGFLYFTTIKHYGHKLLLTATALIIAFSGICAQDQKLNPDYMKYTLQKVPGFKGFEGVDSIPHYFFQLYGGVAYSLAPAGSAAEHPGMEMGIAVGRWVTPIHGVRLGVFGKYYVSYPLGEKVKSNDLGASVDYLMNLSALAKDFNADRKFELVGIAGGEYLLPQFKGGGNGAWGIRAGLQARYALSCGSVFFLEPRAGIYSDNLDFTDSWRGYNVAASVVGGVEFRTIARNRRSAEKFTSSAFRDHWFLMSGLGVGSLVARGGADLYKYVGGNFFAGVGRWLSPFSGIRLTGRASAYKYPVTKSRIKDLGVQADYLLNLNNVFYGYNSERVFNLIGVGGVNYDFVKNREYSNLIGVGAGLQASVRLSDEISFFVEPRLNFYPDRYFATGPNGAGKCRANFMINTGFELKTSPVRSGAHREKMTSASVLDNVFMGVAMGMNSPLKQVAFYKNDVEPRATGYIGKWFTGTSGVRLSADLAKLWESGKRPSAKIATLGVDYLWNVTSFMNGYNPERKFELIAAAGPNLAFRSSSFSHRTYLGGELSLQGLWNVTPAVGVFVEPQLRLYGDKFAERSIRVAKLDGVMAVMGGVNIRLKDCTRAQKQIFRKEDTNHSFFSFSGGANFLATHLKRANAYGVSGQVAYGKWVTPVAGWRLGVNGEYKQENNIKYIYGGAEADYLFSLSNMVFGYDSGRRVNLNAFAGVNAGVDHEPLELSFATGISAGGQLVYKVNKTIDVFVEPKATLRYRFRYNSVNNTRPVMNVQVGVNYKLPIKKADNKKK